jgi:WD40 repeat protein
MWWPIAGSPPRKLLDSKDRMITGLRFSPDGRRLLVNRDKNESDLVAVEIATGAATVLGANDSLRTAVASEDWSKQVIRRSPNALYASVDGTWTQIAKTTKLIQFHAVSPQGDLVMFHDGAAVWSVPFAGGEPKRIADYTNKLLSFEWSPDARWVALVGHAHDVVLVELATGKLCELRGHTDALYTVQWSSDGKRLLSASDDGTARVWTLADKTSIVLRGHDDDVYRARFSSDERMAATASLDGSVRIWQLDASDARVLTETGPIEQLVLDGNRAVVKTQDTVAAWNVATGVREELFSWARDPKSLGLALSSRSGALLIVPAADWSMELRRRNAPPLHLVGHKGAFYKIEFSRDEKYVYTSAADGTLRRWDTTTGASTSIIEGAPVRGFALGGDGRIVAQVGDEARLIVADGTSTVLGAGPRWCISAAEYEPTHDRLLVTRCDRSVAILVGTTLVDLQDGMALYRIAISKDGTRIAGAMNDRTVRVWDAQTGKQVNVLRGHTDLVLDAAFSPDGTQLASSSYDKTIRVWQLGSGRQRVLRGHSGAVERVAWRDAGHLVSGARDGTLRIWEVPSMELPSANELGGRLSSATSARIDLDRPTTLDGARGSS